MVTPWWLRILGAEVGRGTLYGDGAQRDHMRALAHAAGTAARLSDLTDVRVNTMVQELRASGTRGRDAGDHGQRLVFDADQVRGVLGDVARLGDHEHEMPYSRSEPRQPTTRSRS